MPGEIIAYLVVTLVVVGGLLLLERIMAGPHSTSDTGYARVDSAFDYDRLRGRHVVARVACALRRCGHLGLPLLPPQLVATGYRRDVGEQLIPVSDITGSVDGAARLFDQDFRPMSDRAHARLGSVLLAMRRGEPLPPIQVWAWRGRYYVLDGHHRVAAARALRVDYIDALVTEVSEPHPVAAHCAPEPCLT